MPRSNKNIDSGRLDGPPSPARAHSWTKYGGHETAETHRGGSDRVEVTVDDVTVVHREEPVVSKYESRSSSARSAVEIPDGDASPQVEIVREWVVDRVVEGRTYHRSDRLVMVELEI